MAPEPLSPELVLVDPELGARARAALAAPSSTLQRPSRPVPSSPIPATPPPATAETPRAYPIWARLTAALWLLVIGILIGGAAIPHAQDRPRVVPAGEAPICELPQTSTAQPPRSNAPGDTP